MQVYRANMRNHIGGLRKRDTKNFKKIEMFVEILFGKGTKISGSLIEFGNGSNADRELSSENLVNDERLSLCIVAMLIEEKW